MNRLDFTLPEFTRLAWVSEQARDSWEYKIGAISTAWSEIERSSVSSGLRPGGLQSIEPENLVRLQQWCFDTGLGMAITGREGINPGRYSNASATVVSGEPWVYRVYFGSNSSRFSKVWGKDELEVGKLLGYPSCCSTFFNSYWTEAKWRDLIYPMVGCQPTSIAGPFTCNILLRHIGVRATFHLPCSFDCRHSDAIGNSLLEHGRMMGFTDEMNWITEMLNWPIRWSSLHGVTIVTTPILKIVYSSDAFAELVILDREGKGYPDEGATGVEFPFRSSRPIAIQGLEDTWTDNGFTTSFAMRQAHEVILDVVADIPIEFGKVLDLGCGNGMLLEKLKAQHQTVTTYGVDINENKCTKATLRGSEIFWCDVVRTDTYLINEYALILVSLNRLLGLNADLFLSRLHEHTNFLLIYSYEGWDDSINDVITNYFEPVSIAKTGIIETHVLRSK